MFSMDNKVSDAVSLTFFVGRKAGISDVHIILLIVRGSKVSLEKCLLEPDVWLHTLITLPL